MERIQLQSTWTNQDLKEQKTKLIAHPEIQNLIDKLKITDQEIEKHLELFVQYLKTNSDCFSGKNCKNCRHSTKGYQFHIKRDMQGYLTDSLIICPFYQQYYLKKENIIYTTFIPSQILDNANLTFLKDNAQLFGNNLQKLILLQKMQPINGIYFHMEDSKTRKKLLVALCDALLKKYRCSIIRLSGFLSDLKAQFNLPNKTNDLYDKVANSPILIIDDVGGESVSAWSRDEILLPLLDYRIQNELPTILCSDYKLEQLKNLYIKNKNDEVKAEKLIDKIKELTK